jgi:hypothetical protein
MEIARRAYQISCEELDAARRAYVARRSRATSAALGICWELHKQATERLNQAQRAQRGGR